MNCRWVWILVSAVVLGQDAARIMRPVDGAALSAGEVDIIAAAADGTLEVDGKPVTAEKPYPGVLRAKPSLSNGAHTIAVVTAEGRKEIRIFAGPNPPTEFTAFREHPPVSDVACTQCHEVNRRGRFRFKGGCFDCHQQDAFVKAHAPHVPDTLTQCGMCHNAHGSVSKGHLTMTKTAACKQCHD
jgi:predicted CXXCH cytochrome family protein